MKKTFLFWQALSIAVIAAALCGTAFAQNPQNITAASTDCETAGSCVVQSLSQTQGAVGLVVTGTFSATLQFEASARRDDGGNFVAWAALNCFPPNSTTSATSATATGTWQCNVAGMIAVRIRASAYTSGTAVVSISAHQGSAKSIGSFGGAFADLSGTATESQLPIIVDTADQGYFLGVQVFPAASSASTALVTAINQTRVFQFVLPFRVTVGNIVSRVTTGGGAGKLYGIGIYSAAGALMLETGALDANTVAVNKTAITPVTLTSGPYFFAWTSDSTTTQLSAFVVTSGGATDAILNAGSVEKVGTAAASSAGVLPASMGTVTALSIVAIPLVSFER